jgi:hypothetical protein
MGSRMEGSSDRDVPSRAPQVEVVLPDRDGPPPPPFVRARRRRRRTALVVLLAVVVIAVPIALAIVAGLQARGPVDRDTGPGSTAPDGPSDPDRPDPDLPDPVLPDLEQLDGRDAVYGRLLRDIDAAEREMLAFQAALSEGAGGAGGPRALLERAADAAGAANEALAGRRRPLTSSLADADADAVRGRYLAHLDAWIDFVGAVEDDPRILVAEDASAPYNLMINVTADAFARTLEERLPDDLDPAVARFAEDILDRGFRSDRDANV